MKQNKIIKSKTNHTVAESSNALNKGPHPLPHRLGVDAPQEGAHLGLVVWVDVHKHERREQVAEPPLFRDRAASTHPGPDVKDIINARPER